MESGIVKVSEIFKGSTSTTAEEMKDIVMSIAENICGVIGLSITKTVDKEFGVTVYIGESESSKSILAISNNQNSSKFFNLICISRVLYENAIYLEGTQYGSIGLYINNNPIYMKYAKDGYKIALGFANISNPRTSDINNVDFFISKIAQENEGILTVFSCNNAVAYASYNEYLENIVAGTAEFHIGGTKHPIVPSDKDAFLDIYLKNGTKLDGIQLYTNNFGYIPWKVIIVNGERFLIVSMKSVWTLAMKMS